MVTYMTKTTAVRTALFDLMSVSGGYSGTLEQSVAAVERVIRDGITNGTMQVAKRIGRGFRGWLEAGEFFTDYGTVEKAVTEWRSPEHITEHGWTVAYIGRGGESLWVLEEAVAVHVGPGALRHKSDQVSDLKRTRASIEFSLDRTDGRSTEGKRYSKAIAGIDVAIDALNVVV